MHTIADDVNTITVDVHSGSMTGTAAVNKARAKGVSDEGSVSKEKLAASAQLQQLHDDAESGGFSS